MRWGGARINDRYRAAEWRGTINVVNGTINAFAGSGFEHREEACWRAGPTDIAFRADTYGDSIIYLQPGATTGDKQDFGMVVAH